MNIYLQELRLNRKSTLIWTCSIIALLVLYLSLFPAISKDAADFNRLLQGYPEPVRKALGLTIGSVTSLLGFYSFCFSFAVLCGAIQAMIMGASLLSKESREKTADFLLTKPVSRAKIITSKIFAAVTMLFLSCAGTYAVSAALAAAVGKNEYNAKIFFMITATLFFTELIFFAIGTAVSAAASKMRSVLPVSLGTVFGFFFIGMLVSTGDSSSSRFLTPFKYFDCSYIIKNAAYEGRYLLAGAVIILAAIVLSYAVYTKKDIHAV